MLRRQFNKLLALPLLSPFMQQEKDRHSKWIYVYPNNVMPGGQFVRIDSYNPRTRTATIRSG